VQAFYYCPHHPEGAVEAYRIACGCRKPAPGLLEAAARDLGLDLRRSFVVGDKRLDIDCGVAAGCRTVLVRTGEGATQERSAGPRLRADAILNNLMEAAEWILLNSSR
jgi:D-glycero-D-manno-heptose 1,7-bisphosphate phosphatase